MGGKRQLLRREHLHPGVKRVKNNHIWEHGFSFNPLSDSLTLSSAHLS